MLTNEITVSVILITYNSNWEKIHLTLKSILMQKNIELEVIIADDGSRQNWEPEIRQMFEQYKFDNYQIVNSETNVGTCNNLYNAIQKANGKYSKAISPGDLFYNETTLKNWCEYMESNECELSFGDAVFYYIEEKIHFLKDKSAPVNKKVFGEIQKRRAIFVNYLLANDTILGAAIMMKTRIMRNYLEQMIGKVKYAEDYMVRVMVFENKKILYYPKNIIWYEYGTGISTSKQKKWKEMLKRDFDASNELIQLSLVNKDKLCKKYVYLLKLDCKINSLKKIFKCILFPDIIYWRLKSKYSSPKLSEDYEKKYLESQLLHQSD